MKRWSAMLALLATIGALPRTAWATQPCPPGYTDNIWSYAPAGILALVTLIVAGYLLHRESGWLALLVAVVGTLGAFAAMIFAGFTGGCVPT